MSENLRNTENFDISFGTSINYFYSRNFYNISDELDPRCLLVRCHEGKKKNVYFTSPEIRDIVLSNEDRVKMINTGVKTFVRCDNKNMKCAFRLGQEGMKSIFSYIGEDRKVEINKDDLVMLLQNDNPHTPPEIEKLSKRTQERLKDFRKKHFFRFLAFNTKIIIYFHLHNSPLP